MLDAIDKSSLLSGHSKKGAINNDGYKAYFFAFTFDFVKLKNHLKIWKANSQGVLIKGGLLSFLSPSQGANYLKDEFKGSFNNSAELQLYILELLQYVERSRSWRLNTIYQQTIISYEEYQKGITSRLRSILNSYEENSKDKINFWGQGRFSVSSYSNSHNDDLKKSIDFIMLCIESGIQLAIANSQFFTHQNWYKLFQYGFEKSPEAFLFYSLQFNDKDYLKRIAQDYAFSNMIDKKIRNRIAVNLFKGSLEAPAQYSQNILYFLGSFINSVAPNIWEKHFMSLWRKFVKLKEAVLPGYNSNFHYCSTSAFHYIETPANLVEILDDIISVWLSDAEQDTKSVVYDYIYHLARNKQFKELRNKNIAFGRIDQKIEEIIRNISLGDESTFVLGNISYLLNDSQKLTISDLIKELDFGLVKDSRTFGVLLYLTGNDPFIKIKIANAVLTHKNLWDTGYLGKSEYPERDSYTTSDPIEISRLSLSEDGKFGISWNRKTVLAMFSTLKSKLHELEKIYKRKDSFFNHTILAQEMKWFVETYRNELTSANGFLKVQRMVDKFHEAETGYDQLSNGLLSQEHAEVVWALSEVSNNFYESSGSAMLMNLTLNKVLLQGEPALEASLSYLSSWVKRENKNGKRLLNQELLLNLLT